MKSILIFSKWTKINVQNWVAENTLTDKKFCLDKKNYRHKLNQSFLFCYDIFFKKNLKINSQATLWKHLVTI